MRDFIVSLLNSVRMGAVFLGLSSLLPLIDTVLNNTGVLDIIVRLIDGMVSAEADGGTASAMSASMLSEADNEALNAAAIDPALFVQLIQLLWQLWTAFRPKAMAMAECK